MGGYALVRVDVLDVCVLWEEGWGVLCREVHEERMRRLFLNDTSFCHGPGLLVGKWHFSIYPLLEDN